MTQIALTPGEPAGIGPDLVVTLAQKSLNGVTVIADPSLLYARAKLLGLPLTIQEVDSASTVATLPPSEIAVLPVRLSTDVMPGKLNVENASYVLETLDKAIEGCQSGLFDALVTGPVQKSIINEAGISFSGHTEYLADNTQTPRVVMMLATEGLKVALATTHLPLAQVPNAITQESLQEVITILHHDLKNKFGIIRPRILVCGLNPHAGEGGHLGREEIDIISPVLETFRSMQLDIRGPYPADTLFTPEYLEHADAVLAMYHDQGLPVLKHKGFGKAVNITLGLPLIRTSVDHGTALDLAGTGKAQCSSLQEALDYARTMAVSRSAST